MFIIHEWSGRLGNNILQVYRGLFLALHHKDNLTFPPHPYFSENNIFIFPKTKLEEKKVNGEEFRKIPKQSLEELREKVLFLLRRFFKFNFEDIEPEELIIHIRTGDIFVQPHPHYIQPPLIFYKTIIEQRKWNSVRILAEDTKNPVILPLLKEYAFCKCSRRSLNEDMYSLMNAKNVVGGYGSFVPSLILFNNKIENLYVPSNARYDQLEYLYCNIIKYSFPNFMKPGDWKNTPQQHEMMLKHSEIKEVYEWNN